MVNELLVLAASTAEAAHGEESSHVLFYAMGSGLALWGVMIALFGIRRRQAFPTSARTRNAIMFVTTLLVVATCGSAAITG
jgi:hypothetical protein